MENTDENSTGQENNIPVEIPATSLGMMLREARERLGLSVMDVASQTKFAPRQIEALEADDYQRLPEAAFLRGFVRSYAKVLRLDAQTLLAALPRKEESQGNLAHDSADERISDTHSLGQQNLTWLGAAMLVIVVVAGFAYWHFTTPPEQPPVAQVESPVSLPAEAPIIAPAQPLPEVAAVEPVEPVEPKVQALAHSSVQAANTVAPRPAKRIQVVSSDTQSETSSPVTSLRLEFSEDSWAEIKDKDGKILSSRVHPGGSELRVNGHAPFSILIGHASSVRLFYQDKQVDLAPHTRRSTEVASLTLE